MQKVIQKQSVGAYLWTWRFLLWGALGFALLGSWACVGPVVCEPCKEGSTRCEPQSQGVLHCEQIPERACLGWVLRACGNGQRCTATNQGALCLLQAGCPGSCSMGSTKCQGEEVMLCQQDAAENCPDWKPYRVCPAGSSCKDGLCQGVAGCSGTCQDGEVRCEGEKAQVCAKQPGLSCPIWNTVQQCSGNQVCENGQCKGTGGCTPACQKDEKRCVQNTVQACEDPAGDGCFQWGTPTACGSGEICQQGNCSKSCQNVCNVGETRCSGAGYQTCVKDVDSGCPIWGAMVDCPSGQTCKNGQCEAATCQDVCPTGQTRCAGAQIERCEKAATGCTVWNSASCPVGQSCRDNKCQVGCSDACTAGQVRCSGTTDLETCAKDANGCLVWNKTPCAAGQICENNACKGACQDACTLGQTRCAGANIERCEAATSGCTAWKAAACPSGQSCTSGTCQATCPNPCQSGALRCAANDIEICKANATGCLTWSKQSSCTNGDVCSGGSCVKPTDPALRTDQEVCTRWKADYPLTGTAGFQSTGGCDPGSISASSIDDAVRRVNLYRYLVGLPGVVEDTARRQQMQECAVLQANNDGPGSGVNAHSPPSSWNCYTAGGAAGSGSSNLSWGVGHPADTVPQYIADRGTPSLGHRLWIISPGMGKTAFGLATGTGRWRVASCMYSFDRSGTGKADYIAFPPPGPVPIQTVTGSYAVDTWSFTSSKYATTSGMTITLIRKSDNDTQTLTASRISGYGHPSGVSFKPRAPKVGEAYTVQIGTVFSYEIRFFDCK
ncbi:MAG: hypothetical protein H6728_06575 [Myxococcales bacterium]|nr:hypothetical protein [Myxococcales bacterium]